MTGDLAAGDLSGLLVVSVEQAVAAPLASMRLADAGARVIKIERPEGDFARSYDRLVKGQSAYFVWLNRGKESVCLDLERAEDRAFLSRLVSRADVFIQNLKPGSLDRRGLHTDRFRRENPRLITCDITGFGTAGPRSHLKAYDLIVQAEVGLCAITGDDAGPARVGISVGDIAAGSAAHAAILQALIGRERTGQGRGIYVSLFDSLAEWMNVPILQLVYGEHEVQRSGVAHPTIAPYGAFACAGGEQILLAVQNDREWAILCRDILARPDLVDDDRFRDNSSRLANRRLLDDIVQGALSLGSADEACERLEAASIAHGRLNSLRAAAAHPHLRRTTVETANGQVRVIAPPAQTSADHPVRLAVPERGQHTDAIYREFSLQER
jgi:crotonobetainyl-CoA:carnitine CoA-transferase CaiB-like acyl-CoA transferase